MTRKQAFSAAAREQLDNHPGMLGLCARVICYTLALMLSMTLSKSLFGEIIVGTLGMFTLFAFVFELLWSSPHRGSRFWMYIICVLGIAAGGMFLVNEAVHVEKNHAKMATVGQRVHELVTNVPGAAFATNTDGIIRACNDGVFDLTGYKQEELVGQSISLIFPDSIIEERLMLRREAAKEMHGAKNQGWTIRVDENIPLRRKSGNIVVAKMYVFGLRYSVDETYPDDIQFVSFAVEGEK